MASRARRRSGQRLSVLLGLAWRTRLKLNPAPLAGHGQAVGVGRRCQAGRRELWVLACVVATIGPGQWPAAEFPCRDTSTSGSGVRVTLSVDRCVDPGRLASP